MDPITGSLITGGASLLGNFFSNQTASDNSDKNIQMQMQTNQFNAQQAQINRDYQTQMSNTAYQRASADMQKAGLNPAMMFGSGSAASSPGGSVATAQSPRSERVSPFAGLGQAVSQGVNAAVSMKTLDKMTEEIANLRAQEALTAAHTATEAERPEQVRAGTVLTRNEAENIAARYNAAKLEGVSAKDILNMPEWLRSELNQWSYGGRKVSDVVAPILSSATGVRRLLPSRMTRETATDPHTGDRFEDIWTNRIR